jgi:acetate kinase
VNAILVLNAGSSSVKFAAFEHGRSPGEVSLIGKGHIAQVGPRLELKAYRADGSVIEQSSKPSSSDGFEHDEAMTWMFTWLDEHRGGLSLSAVGHRVVHGGQRYSQPVLVTPDILAELDALVPLAPLHQPHNLKAIRTIRERWPSLPQIACFDTAFHGTQPHVAQAFALPRHLTEAGVRRYGFHGLSYEYIATQLPPVLGDRAQGKVIVAHLGSGASLCALVDGKSVASTMGFSALDGLMMGTRCGSIDPGVLLYLLEQLHMNAQDVTDLLYHRAGLLGVSGISSDMQVLLSSAHPHAQEAIELFVYRIVGEIGALAAAMGGIDALVFTAGIGEHAASIRARVCEGCHWLGARLDDNANHTGQELIHAKSSKLLLAVIPTDEEQMVALHVALQGLP